MTRGEVGRWMNLLRQDSRGKQEPSAEGANQRTLLLSTIDNIKTLDNNSLKVANIRLISCRVCA